MDDGIVLVATNQKYIDESRPLVESIRRFMPDVHLQLICEPETPVEAGLFDSCQRIVFDIPEQVEPRYSGFLKRDMALELSPFARTVHMDCDTILGAPLYEMFHALTKFDILIASSPSRIHSFGEASTVLPQEKQLPKSRIVPRVNCGMISYTKNAIERGFFKHWIDLYIDGIESAERNNRIHYSDQSKMRQVLWETDLNTCFMSTEYNFRTGNYQFLDGPVRIAHGRPPISRQRLIDFVNSTHERRAYIPYKGMVFYRNNDHRDIQIYRKWHRKGPKLYTDYEFDDSRFEQLDLALAG